MVGATWTDEIVDLLETLTCRVRVLSFRHLQRGWSEQFGGPPAVVDSVHRLIAADLIVGDVWNVQPSPIRPNPIIAWSPRDAQPNLLEAEPVVRNRWDRHPVPTPVIAATDRASRLFGSRGFGFPPENHRNHDLLLSSVYLRYRIHHPKLAQNWLGEDAVQLAERGVKNPDAFLLDDSGDVVRVIESAGRYSLDQLESFHRHCKAAGLPYELW